MAIVSPTNDQQMLTISLKLSCAEETSALCSDLLSEIGTIADLLLPGSSAIAGAIQLGC